MKPMELKWTGWRFEFQGVSGRPRYSEIFRRIHLWDHTLLRIWIEKQLNLILRERSRKQGGQRIAVGNRSQLTSKWRILLSCRVRGRRWWKSGSVIPPPMKSLREKERRARRSRGMERLKWHCRQLKATSWPFGDWSSGIEMCRWMPYLVLQSFMIE